jgi:hypothetical protein
VCVFLCFLGFAVRVFLCEISHSFHFAILSVGFPGFRAHQFLWPGRSQNFSGWVVVVKNGCPLHKFAASSNFVAPQTHTHTHTQTHTHTPTKTSFFSKKMATSASAPPKSRYCWLLDAVCCALVYRQMCVIEVSVLCGLLGFEYVSCCELLECVLTVGLTVTCWQ